MDERTIALYALFTAVAALLISLPLAWIQIVQFMRDKQPLTVSVNFDGEWFVRVKNPSTRTVLIDRWYLTYRKRFLVFWHKTDRTRGVPDQDLSLRIEAGKHHDLRFEPLFPFPSEPHGRGKLYLEVFFAGSKKQVFVFTGHPYSI